MKKKRDKRNILVYKHNYGLRKNNGNYSWVEFEA